MRSFHSCCRLSVSPKPSNCRRVTARRAGGHPSQVFVQFAEHDGGVRASAGGQFLAEQLQRHDHIVQTGTVQQPRQTGEAQLRVMHGRGVLVLDHRHRNQIVQKCVHNVEQVVDRMFHSVAVGHGHMGAGTMEVRHELLQPRVGGRSQQTLKQNLLHESFFFTRVGTDSLTRPRDPAAGARRRGPGPRRRAAPRPTDVTAPVCAWYCTFSRPSMNSGGTHRCARRVGPVRGLQRLLARRVHLRRPETPLHGRRADEFAQRRASGVPGHGGHRRDGGRALPMFLRHGPELAPQMGRGRTTRGGRRGPVQGKSRSHRHQRSRAGTMSTCTAAVWAAMFHVTVPPWPRPVRGHALREIHPLDVYRGVLVGFAHGRTDRRGGRPWTRCTPQSPERLADHPRRARAPRKKRPGRAREAAWARRAGLSRSVAATARRKQRLPAGSSSKHIDDRPRVAGSGRIVAVGETNEHVRQPRIRGRRLARTVEGPGRRTDPPRPRTRDAEWPFCNGNLQSEDAAHVDVCKLCVATLDKIAKHGALGIAGRG